MRPTILCLLLPLLFLACSASSDPDTLTKTGEIALGSLDMAAAAESFDAALKAIDEDPKHALYLRAQLGLAEALGRTDPARSQEILLTLQKDLLGQITHSHFIQVMNQMAESRAEGAALISANTLKVALKLFPGQEVELDRFAKLLEKKIEKSGNSEAQSAMAGLGYLGSVED